MTTTATIQIGNSDNKLSQQEWSNYWAEVDGDISDLEVEPHFSAGSHSWAPWQNYCWVVAIEESNVPVLVNRLRSTREKYRQDSVALTVGQTEFV